MFADDVSVFQTLEEANRKLLEELGETIHAKNEYIRLHDEVKSLYEPLRVENESTKMELDSLWEKFDESNEMVEKLKEEKDKTNREIASLNQSNRELEERVTSMTDTINELQMERDQCTNERDEIEAKYQEVQKSFVTSSSEKDDEIHLLDEQLRLVKEKLVESIKDYDGLDEKYQLCLVENERLNKDLKNEMNKIEKLEGAHVNGIQGNGILDDSLQEIGENVLSTADCTHDQGVSGCEDAALDNAENDPDSDVCPSVERGEACIVTRKTLLRVQPPGGGLESETADHITDYVEEITCTERGERVVNSVRSVQRRTCEIGVGTDAYGVIDTRDVGMITENSAGNEVEREKAKEVKDVGVSTESTDCSGKYAGSDVEEGVQKEDELGGGGGGGDGKDSKGFENSVEQYERLRTEYDVMMEKLHKAETKIEEWENIVVLLRSDLEKVGEDWSQSEEKAMEMVRESECVTAQLEEALQERDSLRDQVCKMMERDGNILDEMNSVKRAVTELKKEKVKIEESMAEVRMVNEENLAEIGKLQQASVELTNSKAQLEEMNRTGQRQIAEFEEREARLSQQVEECQTIVERLASEKEELLTVGARMEEDLKVRSMADDEVQGEMVEKIEEFRRKLDEKEEEIGVLTTEKMKMEEEIRRLDVFVEENVKTKEELLAEMEEEKGKCQDSEKLVAELQQIIGDLKEEMENREHDIKEKSDEIEGLVDDKVKMSEAVTDLEQRLESARKTSEDLESQLDKVRQELSHKCEDTESLLQNRDNNELQSPELETDDWKRVLDEKTAVISELVEEKSILAATIEKLEKDLQSVSGGQQQEDTTVAGDDGAEEADKLTEEKLVPEKEDVVYQEVSVEVQAANKDEKDHSVASEELDELRKEVELKQETITVLVAEKLSHAQAMETLESELKTAEEKLVELEKVSSDLAEVKADLDAKTAVIDGLEKERADLLESNKQFETQIVAAESVKNTAENLQNDLDKLVEELQERVAEIERKKLAISNLEDHVEELEKITDRLKDDVDNHRHDADLAREEVSQSKQEVEWIKQKLDRTVASAETRLRELDEESAEREMKLRKKVETLTSELEDVRGRADDRENLAQEKSEIGHELASRIKEIRDLEMNTNELLSQMKEYRERIEHLESEKVELDGHIEKERKEVDRLNQELSELNALLADMEKGYEEVKTNNRELSEKAEKCSDEAAGCKRQIEFLEEEKAMLLTELNASRSGVSEIEENFDEIKHDNIDLSHQVQKLTDLNNNLTEDNATLNTRLRELDEDLKRALKQKCDDVQSMESEKGKLSETVEQLRNELQRSTRTVNTLEEEKAMRMEEVDRLTGTLSDLARVNENLTSDVHVLKDTVDKLRTQADQAGNENTALRTALERSEEQRLELRNEIEDLRRETSQLKTEKQTALRSEVGLALRTTLRAASRPHCLSLSCLCVT